MFATGSDVDFSYVSTDGGRFRVNIFRKDTGIGAVFRAIPTAIPTIDSLGLPPVVKKLCDYHQGMILVTGSTGSGKSTTLAAMIDLLNTTRKLNIISLEDPIEFVHRSKQSQVIQRELNTHLPTFAEGVRAAMREDPDVILVGEMRDAETISMAMTAAETGHLVLGTLHTTGAVKTIDRIIDALPVEEREQTKSFLSQSLLAVVTQVLCKTTEGQGRKAVCEVMVMTKAIAKLIQTDQTHQIPSQVQMGREFGMQLLDQALLSAVQAKEIDPDHAYSFATRQARAAEVRDRHGAAAEARYERHHRQQAGLTGAPAAMAKIDEYLREVLHRKGSDLHFIAGDPARIRLYGDLQPLRPDNLSAEFVHEALYEIMPGKAAARFEKLNGADFAYTLEGLGRFRVNVMRQLNGIGRGIALDTHPGADHGPAQIARRGSRLCARAQRADPGHRQDRQRQVHHAGRDHRRHQQA